MEFTPLLWTLTLVIIIGLLLFGLIFVAMGDPQHAVEYYSGDITEKALSVDNLFVFLVIMASFQVPREFQQKVLLFGITFALISRTAFIFLGAAIIERWSDVFYLSGLALLLVAGQQLRSELTASESHKDDADNVMVRLARRFLPASDKYHGDKLFTRINGRRMMTPMLLVMVAIGATDLLFAFDSIPAIFGLTQEPYIVFAATAFSLMGLRRLYFLIDGLLDRLVYLSYGLAAILGFIGVKLVLHALHENNLPFINDGQEVPVQEILTTGSLLVIVFVLLLTVVASLLSPKGKALRALQNAERFAFRYTKLDQAGTDAERRRAEELMDRWTQAAQTVSEKHREELLEHKHKYSSVIRTAHETRLADAQHKGVRAPVSEAVVNGSGRAPDSA